MMLETWVGPRSEPKLLLRAGGCRKREAIEPVCAETGSTGREPISVKTADRTKTPYRGTRECRIRATSRVALPPILTLPPSR